jgi:hypothetical protein
MGFQMFVRTFIFEVEINSAFREIMLALLTVECDALSIGVEVKGNYRTGSGSDRILDSS